MSPRPFLLLIIVFLAACSLQPAAVAPSPTNAPAASPTGEPATATAEPSPTSSPTATEVVIPIEQQSLLFASDASGHGGLYIRENGVTRQIPLSPEVESAWQPALSPDGRQILFTGRRHAQSDIGLVALEGGAVTWLTEHPADDYSPAWSPNGARMSWVSEMDGRAHVWAQRLDNSDEPFRLPLLDVEKPSRTPVFMPDGSLVYALLNERGSEAIYQFEFETGRLRPRVEWPFKGTQPAVNGQGEVVFVGWEEKPPWRGLYVMTEVVTPTLLWETTDWIGEPAWSEDGDWILFTRAVRDGSGHDLWALPTNGGEPRQLTNGWAWETDAAAVNKREEGEPSGPSHGENATASSRTTDSAGPRGSSPLTPGEFIAGFNVAGLDAAYLSREVGFGWGKGYAFWERIESERGVYDWRDVDNTVMRYEEAGLKVFLRVDRTPAWARPVDTPGSHPPTDMEAYARFLEALATRYKGRVHAYELWNEPNLRYEWGGLAPDPARYVELLRVARPALQRGDPVAKLVVGALAVTSNTDQGMDDLDWMEGFYQALGPHDGTLYDAFSTHPYGFAQPPDFPPEQGLGLRRLEWHRAIMEKYGDPASLWLTEIGYPRHAPAWDLGKYHLWMVSDDLQGEYIVQTLDFIQANYPYVEAAFFFNLDFSTVDWYGADEQMRAFAILDSARRPLPAYTRLRERALQARQLTVDN